MPTPIKFSNKKRKYEKPAGYTRLYFLATVLCAIGLGYYFRNAFSVSYSYNVKTRNAVEVSMVSKHLNDTYNLCTVTNTDDHYLYLEGFRNHGFNQLVSDRLPVNRSLPDTRTGACRKLTYGDDLPTLSVIISFYNEALSALLRTVQSVLDRTPPHLLSDVILIDDNSDLPELSGSLSKAIRNLSKVRLLRNEERLGLIQSRNRGSREATGQVLAFLDSHCEVNVNWAEPLLSRIAENNQTVVSPVIDSIDSHTLTYDGPSVFSVGFSWNLLFRWEALSDELEKEVKEKGTPFRSPVTCGGIFAIDKGFFRKLGEFDPALQIWGGDNVEMSFKVWQCGGQIEVVPCSRVGHIYRPGRTRAENDVQLYYRNLARVAKVWMDDYSEVYFKYQPDSRVTNIGDLTDRITLRRNLGCRTFKWYLENVYTHQVLPTDPTFSTRETEISNRRSAVARKGMIAVIIRMGKLYHNATGLCIRYRPEGSEYTVKLGACQPQDTTDTVENWSETNRNDFRLSFTGTPMCLTASSDSNSVVTACAFKFTEKLIWRKRNNATQLFNPGSGKCLKPLGGVEGAYLGLDYCNDDDDTMRFEWLKT